MYMKFQCLINETHDHVIEYYFTICSDNVRMWPVIYTVNQQELSLADLYSVGIVC
jgi:hypothetical protein